MSDERTLSETSIDTVVEKTMSGKKNVIMDSQILTSLMSCPRLTDFRFNHNLMSVGGKSNSLEVGSIIHKFLETYYKSQIQKLSKTQAQGFGFAAAELYIRGCKDCTDFTPFQCLTCEGTGKDIKTGQSDNMDVTVIKCSDCNGTGQINKPKCGHQVNEYPGVHNTPKESEGYTIGWHYALDTIQQYLDHYKNDSWTPIEVERVRGEILYQDDEIRVLWKAKLDTVMDTNVGSQPLVPMDHKTMKQNRNTISLNNQFMGQCILTNSRVLYINKIGFQKTLKPSEKFLRVPINYSAERLMEWQSETLPYYARLLLMYSESGHFPPSYTNCETKYGNCSFLPVCESEQSMRENEIKRLFVVGPTWNPTNDNDE
jgi:hypothetical protein